MPSLFRRAAICSAAVALSATVLIRAQSAPPATPRQPGRASDRGSAGRLRQDIQPIFERYCADCHGRSKARAQLRLHTPEWIRKGGQSGPVVIAGNSHSSELMRRVLDRTTTTGCRSTPIRCRRRRSRGFAPGSIRARRCRRAPRPRRDGRASTGRMLKPVPSRSCRTSRGSDWARNRDRSRSCWRGSSARSWRRRRRREADAAAPGHAST